MKKIVLIIILILAMIAAGGCAGQDGRGQADTDGADSRENALEDSGEQNGESPGPRKSVMIAENDETAEYMELTVYKVPQIDILHLKTLEEFGSKNEGGVALYEDDNILEFALTKNTGSVTGAIDGPRVAFKMDLDTNEILEKEFWPAPEFPNPEQAQFSGEVLEIPDERLVEIGLYFKDLFDTWLPELRK